VPVPLAVWAPRCWHLVPSCVRALRRCSTSLGSTSAWAMSTWS
jgi:TIGR00045: glycerate kinase